MPKVPSLLPQDLMQKSQPDPASFLLAAAEAQSNKLEQSARSMPSPASAPAPGATRSPRRFKVIK